MSRHVKKGVGYTRVSTKEQGKVQNGSLEQQAHEIRRYLQHSSQEGSEYELINIFSEERSGIEEKYHLRDQFQKVLKLVEEGKVDFVVFQSRSRLGRSQYHDNNFLRAALANNVEVHFCSDGGIYDHDDKGHRVRHLFSGFMAEEESLETSARVSKKQRGAMVNNGKDSSTRPELGLDPHPTKVCCYVPNYEELKVVKKIMEHFCNCKSLKQTALWTQSKGYKTKSRKTKESTDKNGNIIKPRMIGGEDFDSRKLKGLLISPKYRGCNRFKDTLNQFPQLQDSEGYVEWEYAHHREHGTLIEKDLIKRVDETLEKLKVHKPKSSKFNTVYLLSGVLKDHRGNPFHGKSAKSGKNFYYGNNPQDKQQRKTIRKDDLEKIVCDRIKQYFIDSGSLKNVISNTLKSNLNGLPIIEEKIPATKQKVKELGRVVEGFTANIRNAQIDGSDDQFLKSLIHEKISAEQEFTEKEALLESLEARKKEILEEFEKRSLEDYLKKVVKHWDKINDLKKKAIVQAIFPEIIIREDNKIELRVSLNPEFFKGKSSHLRNKVAMSKKWRERRDSNPRPSA